jgi:hypothetical protein
MKKFAFIVLSIGLTSIAMADPIGLKIVVNCPAADGNLSNLSRFPGYIAGFGNEVIDERHDNKIYFKSTTLSSKIPENLSNYRNRDVAYSNNGLVTCTYTSMQYPQEDNFSLSYQLTNAQGGMAETVSPKSVVISVPMAVK